MKNFRLIFLSIIVSLFSITQAFARPEVEEYVLEDGMHAYILEDYSSALVRVELTAAAGFSSQSPDNAGFFPLYTKLFKYAAPLNRHELSDLESECNSDAARYIIYVTPDELKSIMQAMSKACFEPFFQDEDILRELAEAKKTVSDNAFSVEGFINSSIDSRVFADSPWKHDSGIYPTLFSKTSASSCRLILSSISDRFYVPKNCALFISGPVAKENALALAEATFGKAPVKYSVKTNEETPAFLNVDSQNQKLFVLSDPEFSPDMTQIVVQYKNLKMEECDYAAAVLNNDGSSFKYNLLSDSSLGIRSPEYINAASTHKNNCSRLIIQSLMENPKTSPCQNTLKFVEILKSSFNNISSGKFAFAGNVLKSSFEGALSNSSKTMDLLSQFWAVKDFSRENSYDSDFLVSNFFDRPVRLSETSLDGIKSKLDAEEPYVFVLVNSTVLKKYEKQFQKNGFEIVTSKNGSWYTQKLYAEIKKSLESKNRSDSSSEENLEASNNLFVEKNQNSVKQFELVNKIPVYIKPNEGSSTVCFCLVLDGGEIADDKNDYGLESVIVNSVALKAKSFLFEKYQLQKIRNFPEVKSQTDLTSSAIYVECLASDLYEVIECFSNALIFSDFIPAMVDSVVLQRKSDQIVKTSSPVYQLYSNGISILFKNKEYQVVNTLEKDILKKIEFTKILEGTTKLFNSDKYKIIICGNIEGSENSYSDLVKYLDEHFGMISGSGKFAKPVTSLNAIARKSRKIRLVHLFLTDVSKEKAGPRPQVLIPTTEFLDPAQFWVTNTNSGNTDVVFNALLNDFAITLQKECDKVEQKQKMIVMTQSADSFITAGTITFLNVKTASVIDDIYMKVFEEYKADLNEETIKRIKNNWIRKYMSDAFVNSQTCLYIKDSLDFSDADPEKYVKDYQYLMKAEIDEFKKVFDDFNFNSILHLYSNDTKR